MMMTHKLFLWTCLLLTILPFFVFAQEPYHLQLLAVQEENDVYTGSKADLYLELKEGGSGRVFLDTYPLTKLDTQGSTRFAKEIACTHFKLPCHKYDFIFTIKSESNIIGGPSAGAAVAALTTIAVLDLPYDQDIAITGTINSGGLVGPVGGIKEKLEAAKAAGLKKVLIAKGSGIQPAIEPLLSEEDKNSSDETSANETNSIDEKIVNETIILNETINLLEYAQHNLSLPVIEVIDLDEVILQLTGVDLNHQPVQVQKDAGYEEIMGNLQRMLCNRTLNIEREIEERGLQIETNVTQQITKRKGNADNATMQQDYYSAASYCFGNNIQLKSYYYREEELSKDELQRHIESVTTKAETIQRQLEKEQVTTISDVQTMMIVKERLGDVQQNIKEFTRNYEQFSPADLGSLVAYAEERLYSALAWRQFFGMDGKTIVIDSKKMQDSCLLKIQESEERAQYVGLFISSFYLQNIDRKIAQAKDASSKKEYELCLITASQAKADADVILSTLGLRDEVVDEYVKSKRAAVERVIVENTAEGMFPILGYSYYQYANSLEKEEPYTALVYLEYALEMSDLQIYFPQEKAAVTFSSIRSIESKWWYALGGVVVGVGVGFIVGILRVKKKKRKR